ncbi:MAG: peptidyl-prolyl cis-trans isomerase [Candidatus Latescibacterota bacterium]|jgi:parvulin-like peptidyl-prolyl isomerase
MKTSKTVLAGLCLTLAVSLISCSSREDTVLAEFKDKKITVADYEKAYSVVMPKYLPKATGIEGHKEFLNTMLNKAIMAYKADELGYDKDPAVVEGMEAFKAMALQVALIKFSIDDLNEVTEEQIREHYRNKGSKVQIKQILVDTPDEAEEVYQLLVDGADFESVCKQYSVAPDAEMGGEIHDVTYGNYAPDMQDKIFSQPIGGITRPIWTQYGFFIMKIVDRTEPRKNQEFDEVRDDLEQEVKAMNELRLKSVVNNNIMEKAGLTWYWENLGIAFRALPPDRPITNAPDRRDEVYPLLYFESQDLDKPLATYKDKVITIRDFSDYYDQTSFFERPRREARLAGIKLFLGHFILKELIAEEVTESNIENRKEVKAAIDGKREELMVSRLYDDMVNSQTTVTKDMISDYYIEHRDMFHKPEERRFGVIVTKDLESAEEAYKKVHEGERFYKVATEYSIDKETLDNLAETDMLKKGQQPALDEVGFNLKEVGAVSRPFQTPKGWVILKLKEKSDATDLSLDRARDSISRAVKQRENEIRLNDLLEKWKAEYGLVIHEDKLDKIQVEPRIVGDKA